MPAGRERPNISRALRRGRKQQRSRGEQAQRIEAEGLANRGGFRQDVNAFSIQARAKTRRRGNLANRCCQATLSWVVQGSDALDCSCRQAVVNDRNAGS
jgi:hypothetical protein